MRLLVFAYQAVGYACLKALVDAKETVTCVVTHLDRPDERIWFPSVAELARRAGIPVRFAEEMTSEEIGELARAASPDVIYAFYYRNLLPSPVLETARLGAYNMHGSLLPRYRGRCPVNWVILRGERETGVTLHHMTARPDAGDIVGQKRIPISARETARTLYEKIVPASVELLDVCHPMIRGGRAPRLPQDQSRATYFGGRRPEDGEIDWSASAREIDALVRAVTHPFPGAFTFAGRRKLLVWGSYPVAAAPPRPAGRVLGAVGRSLRVTSGAGVLDVVSGSWEGDREVEGAALAAELKTGEALGRGRSQLAEVGR